MPVAGRPIGILMHATAMHLRTMATPGFASLQELSCGTLRMGGLRLLRRLKGLRHLLIESVKETELVRLRDDSPLGLALTRLEVRVNPAGSSRMDHSLAPFWEAAEWIAAPADGYARRANGAGSGGAPSRGHDARIVGASNGEGYGLKLVLAQAPPGRWIARWRIAHDGRAVVSIQGVLDDGTLLTPLAGERNYQLQRVEQEMQQGVEIPVRCVSQPRALYKGGTGLLLHLAMWEGWRAYRHGTDAHTGQPQQSSPGSVGFRPLCTN